jgi:hypothetical protein
VCLHAQDAAEFWRHLLELLSRAEHAQVGERLACSARGGLWGVRVQVWVLAASPHSRVLLCVQGARLAQAAGTADLQPTSSSFAFNVETRTQCGTTGAVSYRYGHFVLGF